MVEVVCPWLFLSWWRLSIPKWFLFVHSLGGSLNSDELYGEDICVNKIKISGLKKANPGQDSEFDSNKIKSSSSIFCFQHPTIKWYHWVKCNVHISFRLVSLVLCKRRLTSCVRLLGGIGGAISHGRRSSLVALAAGATPVRAFRWVCNLMATNFVIRLHIT